MKKSGLDLDYEQIRERIEKEKAGIKPSVWAQRVGVAPNVVSNVHGKTRQNPSLEYIIYVAKATKRPVEYYLWGEDEKKKSELHIADPDPEVAELLEQARGVLKSGNQVAFEALKHNIRYFNQAVAAEKRVEELENSHRELEKKMDNVLEMLTVDKEKDQKPDQKKIVAKKKGKEQKT